MPAVMTTQPKTDITRGDQQSCLGLMACQYMKGFGNDSQSVVQCAAKAPLWRFHPFNPLFLPLSPEYIQPFHIQSASSLLAVNVQVKERDEEDEGERKRAEGTGGLVLSIRSDGKTLSYELYFNLNQHLSSPAHPL